jgi:hypothetical protein
MYTSADTNMDFVEEDEPLKALVGTNSDITSPKKK